MYGAAPQVNIEQEEEKEEEPTPVDENNSEDFELWRPEVVETAKQIVDEFEKLKSR